MPYKEAIRVLDGIRDEGGWTNSAYNSLTLGIKSLEKQIPMKPIEKFAFSDDIEAGLCPLCNEGVNEEMHFCSYCGQAIDWR